MGKEQVARVSEIIAESPNGFMEAVNVGFARASKDLTRHYRDAGN